jgi:hypothetical protein
MLLLAIFFVSLLILFVVTTLLVVTCISVCASKGGGGNGGSGTLTCNVAGLAESFPDDGTATAICVPSTDVFGGTFSFRGTAEDWGVQIAFVSNAEIEGTFDLATEETQDVDLTVFESGDGKSVVVDLEPKDTNVPITAETLNEAVCAVTYGVNDTKTESALPFTIFVITRNGPNTEPMGMPLCQWTFDIFGKG